MSSQQAPPSCAEKVRMGAGTTQDVRRIMAGKRKGTEYAFGVRRPSGGQNFPP